MSKSSTEIILEFDGKEVTEEQKADITALKYIDNDELHIDDLQITTRNRDIISGVSEIKLALIESGQNRTDTRRILDCGKFTVDDAESDFKSGFYTIKASAVNPLSKIRQSAKCQAWERANLKEIAKEIAERNKTSIIYTAQTNPIFARKEQICESDIKFLYRICQTAGLKLKYTKNALIIYNPCEQEGGKPVRTFKKGETGILESRLYHQKDDTDYAKCRVFYMDPVKKELIEYTYQRREDGRKIELQQKVSGTEEAALLAKNIMRGKNSKEHTGCLECGGDIALATGNIIALSGYGEHDGKYIITKSVQKINEGIHTTRIWFAMAMEGY